MFVIRPSIALTILEPVLCQYALEWMGHSSSAILDLYFTMNDQHSQHAMNSMTFYSEPIENRTELGQSCGHETASQSQVTSV